MSKLLFQTSTIADGNMSFRFGESSEVVENRRRFLSENAVDYADCIPMACNHTDTITAVNRSTHTHFFGPQTQSEQLTSEVLVTNEKGVALMLLTADCLPTLFYDPVYEVIALAHLNRKTIAYDLGQKTVGFLTEHYGTNPKNIQVQIGPHIKSESYTFPLPLIEPTPPQLEKHMCEKNGQVSIDLVSAEIDQLTNLGVLKQKITVSKIDTATSNNHFSHHRSTRNTTHPYGRLATILMLPA